MHFKAFPVKSISGGKNANQFFLPWLLVKTWFIYVGGGSVKEINNVGTGFATTSNKYVVGVMCHGSGKSRKLPLIPHS